MRRSPSPRPRAEPTGLGSSTPRPCRAPTHASAAKRGGPPRPDSALSTPKHRWSRPCTARRNLLGSAKAKPNKTALDACKKLVSRGCDRQDSRRSGWDTRRILVRGSNCHDGRFRGRRRGARPRSIPSARISRPPASSALPHPNRGCGRRDSRQKCCGKHRCIASIRSIYCVNWSASELKRYNQSQRSPWRAAPKT